MKHYHTQNDLQSVDSPNYSIVLNNWLEATSTFHCHYNRLASHANRKLNSITNRNPLLANKLRILLGKMKHELRKLVRDMELTQAPDLANAGNQYNLLINHTRTLNRLNKEAEAIDQLTSLNVN